MPTPSLSIVVPLRDEEENIPELHAVLAVVLDQMDVSAEIIFVDDGSRDRTWEIIKEIIVCDPRVCGLRFGKNFGQSAALAAGFHRAQGNVIVTMDGDGQNDPSDIPRLLESLEAGNDVVSGWRRDRQDPFLTRRLPSWIANRIIGFSTGTRLKDIGCTLKAYRRDVAADLPLYGEMHRFLPALAAQSGARVAEIPVTHHPRRHGKSKYSAGRVFKVVLDLLTVKFLADFASKPLHVFGGVGLVLCVGGTAAAVVTLWQKIHGGVWVHRNPLLLVAVFLFILGANLFLMGLLAELVTRFAHRSDGRTSYRVRETAGGGGSS